MNRLKKFGKALLFPPIPLLVMLVPIAAGLVIYALAAPGVHPGLAYCSYFLSAYGLTLLCARAPALFKKAGRIKENKYVSLYQADPLLRVKISLYGSLIINALYVLLQLLSGLHYRSFWFYTLAVYYALLALMRFFLLRDLRTERGGEWRRYRLCGLGLLALTLALGLMVFFIVYWNRGFAYSEVLTIAMAAFTFFSMTKAIIHVVKYRRYERPVLSAAKAISLASALVSMLSLETAMFSAFGSGDPRLRRIMTAATGAAVCLLVLGMAVYMIIRSSREIKKEFINESGT